MKTKISFLITGKCFNNCNFCATSALKKIKKNTLPIQRIVSIIQNTADAGHQLEMVSLTGGEIFLYKDEEAGLSDLVRKIVLFDVNSINLQSSGKQRGTVNFDKEIVRLLKLGSKKIIMSTSFSLLRNSSSLDYYKEVLLESIPKFIALTLKGPLQINTVFGKSNANATMVELNKLLAKLDYHPKHELPDLNNLTQNKYAENQMIDYVDLKEKTKIIVKLYAARNIGRAERKLPAECLNHKVQCPYSIKNNSIVSPLVSFTGAVYPCSAVYHFKEPGRRQGIFNLFQVAPTEFWPILLDKIDMIRKKAIQEKYLCDSCWIGLG